IKSSQGGLYNETKPDRSLCPKIEKTIAPTDIDITKINMSKNQGFRDTENVSLKKVKDQGIVITGASSGIGLVTARVDASMGAKVVVAARNEDALKQLVKGVGQTYKCTKKDLNYEFGGSTENLVYYMNSK